MAARGKIIPATKTFGKMSATSSKTDKGGGRYRLGSEVNLRNHQQDIKVCRVLFGNLKNASQPALKQRALGASITGGDTW